MRRIPEPELMDGEAQAEAYARADFSAAHDQFVTLFKESFASLPRAARVLDLGCGPADVTIRFATAFPDCELDAIDGSGPMLDWGRRAVARAGLDERIHLVQGYLPGGKIPRAHYQAIISNSLLHHLNNPQVLWDCVQAFGRPGTAVFVMDLLRPDSPVEAERLVDTYAADAPTILRRDFCCSLQAAYRLDEVREQLETAGLDFLEVRAVSDRHLTVRGYLPAASG